MTHIDLLRIIKQLSPNYEPTNEDVIWFVQYKNAEEMVDMGYEGLAEIIKDGGLSSYDVIDIEGVDNWLDIEYEEYDDEEAEELLKAQLLEFGYNEYYKCDKKFSYCFNFYYICPIIKNNNFMNKNLTLRNLYKIAPLKLVVFLDNVVGDITVYEAPDKDKSYLETKGDLPELFDLVHNNIKQYMGLVKQTQDMEAFINLVTGFMLSEFPSTVNDYRALDIYKELKNSYPNLMTTSEVWIYG